ncbi:DUF7547 family protein [Halococcus saccharolyticus]|uniref:Uncharacterized protein n=1 Tax=Halococcus saccharolyticus DSM 5350 TaxID=1227455 RepID=M0MI33_9EURY|nr:hypothetical protein [Halococcus saccharolyticus]EMA45382.1 hypothetical protein C449_07145 [Halococcus saccharolyticus DSM 5350]
MSDRPDDGRRSGDDRRRDRGTDQDLGRLAGDLSTTLDDLRDELERERGPPRGPLGLPRPPTPGELVRFTDEYTIPTAIAVLEANIRLLEALQGVIRLARTGEEARERGREMRSRTERLGRDGLDRLDDVLVDLQDALDGRPENPEARTLLDDARALRREIDDRLDEAEDGSRADTTRARGSADGEPDDTELDATDDPAGESVTIDVDSELDSIRDEVDGDDDDEDES